MAHARISMHLPPNINPTQADIAYGCWALPNLNKELQSEDLQTRQKALMALCDLMHDPEYVYEAINIGCLESLTALLKDSDSLVRIKTTEVLHIMATHNVGRTSFLEHDIILALSFLLNDPHSACRENLHRVYKQLAQLPSGAWGIINSGLIPSLVWKLQREEEGIQELILDTLAPCLQEDATEALGSRAVPFLKQKLLSSNKNIRSRAAQVLIAISIPLEGKNQVRQYDVIPILVDLLKDEEQEVQANAAGALMYATVTTEGKYAALDADAIDPLLQLLSSPLTRVCLNATKALTMLAEAPEGRKRLQPQVPAFRILESDGNQTIQRAAWIAIKVIEWKP
ncbi:radial spoke head 14 homolog [Heterocephalus glaber]|uniref:Radial spoke head 14 homolog n=1 Tax=Heterocephalus glaber TaxID=10181 RepID=A0AAX6SX80_HETGA|nr:radial spoke head 14 homolog [Heterocephalus glaber]XP_012927141.1 radial spoke head 14 homolog [Heterocephalus glaber]XP_021112925.1 radial spoke head 14 homolog [Heterocephalus glaber]XP_021112926.1 radial spoke head 14 homolog [Heterocephalus glaber]